MTTLDNTHDASLAASASEHPYTDAVVKLVGEDGNAFAILARVSRAIRRSNHPELADAFMREATSGDYDHLLQTCLRYVAAE